MMLLGSVLSQACYAQDSLESTEGIADITSSIQSEPIVEQKRVDWLNAQMQLPRLIQRISGKGTLVVDNASDDLTLSEFSTSATVMMPDLLFETESMFSLTPSFSVVGVEAPTGIDLPTSLYQSGITLGWMKRASDTVNYTLGIAPTVSSDFQTSENAFRLTAFGMMNYQWNSQVQFMLGAAYLDRNDISVLPVAGIVWTPREDLRVEIAAPRPRIARRLHTTTLNGSEVEDWFYVAGEFGGGTWAVERNPRFADELTMRDFRVVFGYEYKTNARVQALVEFGYVFGRSVEYQSDDFEYEPGDAMMMRASVSF
jgi:hypothetical protein